MEKQFERFIQLGLIVVNINSAVENWESYGIRPWKIVNLDSDECPEFLRVVARGRFASEVSLK